MQDDHKLNKAAHRNNRKRYFVVAYVFLLAMALFWSVDDSFVYIFLGIAVFFLFLGVYSEQSSKLTQHSFQASRKKTEAVNFADAIKTILQREKKPTGRSESSPGKASTGETNRRIASLVTLAIFIIFIVVFIASIFSSSGEWDDSTLYFQTAEQQYWAGNYDSAYINYRKAFQLNDKYVEAMVGYGNVLAMKNQADSAVLMFDKARTISPSYKEAGYSKASLLYNQEKYSASISVLKQLLQENPDYYDAMLLIGDCYYVEKQYEDAILWYQNAYENGGARSQALCHIMAFIYDSKGDYSRAINLYKEALSYDSSVVDIYKRLGELLPNDDGTFYRTQAVKLQQP